MALTWALRVRAPIRNVELLLLAGPAAFVVLAWLALEQSPSGAPPESAHIVAQFLVSIAIAHLAVRALAPDAAPILAIASMLAAVGLAFVMRLAPEAATAQANWVTIGVLAMGGGILAGRRAHLLRRWTYTAGVLALAALAATAAFGESINGARLWVEVGGQLVQTTELIKAFLVVFLAGYLSREAGVFAAPGWLIGRWRYLLPLGVFWLGCLAALVALRDLGTLAILAALAAVLLTVATGRLGFLVLGGALVAATGALGTVMLPHVATRIDAWLHPFDDPLGSGYQTVQATFALSNGGVTGTGLGWGMATAIPAVATDYVFVAVAEEFGLVGATGLVLTFVLLVIGGLQVAALAPDAHRRHLATAVALLFGIQAAVIIAGNLRLVPTTGVTLPFVSYGGASLVVNFALLGLLLGVDQSRYAS